MDPYPATWLPPGVCSRYVENVNGLRMHILEAGFESGSRGSVLLLHGFPELAYSWRRILVGLAEAGFHVVAPDQRGYGRTTGWDADYDADPGPFRPFNLVRDALGLVRALGLDSVYLAGHDFGSPVAAWCAMVRPDVFRRVVLMSAPFGGPPPIRDGSAVGEGGMAELNAALAGLSPPRKHYQRYYQTREANEDLWRCPQGVHDFLRAYYHHKSADWPGNRPHALPAISTAGSATERMAKVMAELPTYYVMNLNSGMAATVAEHMPDARAIAANEWLPDSELAVYSSEYERTGFQGGLNWYRASGLSANEQQLFSGLRLTQPALFISGASDWGTHQLPGSFERMQADTCADLRGVHLVPGAGHWVQQEQPEATLELLLEFLAD